MPRPGKSKSKTERILTIYHLFRFCEEVSMQELRDSLPEFSDKTFSRDISLMKRAGIPIRFSGRRKAFVMVDENGNETRRPVFLLPDYPESAKEIQFIDKIIRLVTIMGDLPFEDCDVWYRETFPYSSKRTMQRDFALLKRIGPGYRVYYKREWNDPDEKDDEQPPGHYYFEGVFNA